MDTNEKYTCFRDIPRFTPSPTYCVHVSWSYLEKQLSEWESYPGGLELEPDFQRGHVWTELQQTKFVEYGLRGGLEQSGSMILFNCSDWGDQMSEPIQCVDGLQRLTAVRRFLANEIKAFGSYFREFEDRLRVIEPRFQFLVNNLPDRAAVLKWYLELNSGGTVHSDEEIARVGRLLEEERARFDNSARPGVSP